MSTPDGWDPLTPPKRRAGADAFHLSPFARMARAHVLVAMADALVAVALANSLFFDLDPNDARWKVFLYLALTMAPLAIVAPFIGPLLDRSTGGRRWMIVAVNAARAVVCLVMIDDLQSLLLFPEAFAVLALGKAYAVSRSALVPTVVATDAELVEANSKLQLLSGLAVPMAALPGGIAYLIAEAEGVLVLAVVVYAAATLAALRIPATKVAPAPATAAETAELRGAGIVLASSAMGLVRGVVGFTTFFLLFNLRADPKWHLAVVFLITGFGALLGSALAPTLRRSFSEERMLTTVLGIGIVGGLVGAWLGGLPASMLVAGVVALVSTTGRLAFDSLVQRDAPDANRGRSFARFELRFQMVWVIGAVIPVIVPVPERIGFLVVAGVAGFALFSYLAGQRRAPRADVGDDPEAPDATAVAGPPPVAADPTSVDWTRIDDPIPPDPREVPE